MKLERKTDDLREQETSLLPSKTTSARAHGLLQAYCSFVPEQAGHVNVMSRTHVKRPTPQHANRKTRKLQAVQEKADLLANLI